MSRRRLFVAADRLSGERVVLTGDEHRHIARVLRARSGDTLTLFDGAGTEIEARVLTVGPREAELALGERRAAAAAAVAITLLVAVPRGERMDWLVQKTTELGVARIVPVSSARSVALPEASRRPRWEKIAQEAARQCGRADVPRIDDPTELSAALAAPDLPPRRLALWEGERARSLSAALEADATTASTPAALLIGPEGGFADEEVAAAERAGFAAVGLGPRILRVETAAVVAVALVQAAAGGLG